MEFDTEDQVLSIIYILEILRYVIKYMLKDIRYEVYIKEIKMFFPCRSAGISCRDSSNSTWNCSAWLRLKLNTKIGFHTTTTHHHHPPPPITQTLRQQYLSCYWPDLDQTLNKGSWEHIHQITTVTTTFVHATYVLGTFVHISNISAVTGPIWIKL